jgi:hypothetical protein
MVLLLYVILRLSLCLVKLQARRSLRLRHTQKLVDRRDSGAKEA